eukprot:TRINITY_DN1045_c1_g1_i1.p2 TRINITY_DN1045_c1_g1~~TRINITY_DN1045_c1_g1_i1.p2  ORF type:complete len:82 (+),score=24.58 TRINITY_DN1045_c1_g1_i1:153-398(+)
MKCTRAESAVSLEVELLAPFKKKKTKTTTAQNKQNKTETKRNKNKKTEPHQHKTKTKTRTPYSSIFLFPQRTQQAPPRPLN